jgi:[NiFe] hydrogenase small subunit
MRIAVGLARDNVEKRLQAHGINRRQFLRYCTAVAVAMGLGLVITVTNVLIALNSDIS